jgi:hypothetical protein
MDAASSVIDRISERRPSPVVDGSADRQCAMDAKVALIGVIAP